MGNAWGSAERRFRESVYNGDEDKANECFYEKQTKISKKAPFFVNPNSCVTRSTSLTLLQCAALHAMEKLYWDFLSMGGDLFTTADDGATICHLICTRTCSSTRNSSTRYNMLTITIEEHYKGAHRLMECIDAQDQNGDSLLHRAARSNLLDCVEYLVGRGCHIFAQNAERQTACDVAAMSMNFNVAQYLESKMVFAPSITEAGNEETLFATQEVPRGLTTRDLQCRKDGLLVETADLLGVSLYDAEALLRKHDWSKESLLDAWMNDVEGTCENAGIQPPQAQGHHSDLTVNCISRRLEDNVECEICFMLIKELIIIPCQHHFCHECWTRYLQDKIEVGETNSMLCPAYGCYKFIPVDVVNKMTSKKIERKFMDFDLKAFVDGNPRMRWCPQPGCEDAIELPLEELQQLDTSTSAQCRDVCCGNGHFFCWGCGEQPHEPCSCEHWKQWQEKIQGSVTIPKGAGVWKGGESADNLVWLSTHSKPCPKCKAPIQKNEGCNHMHCFKCKHDFCWACMESWNKHSSATGGYFWCNRYDEVKRYQTLFKEKATEAQKNAARIHDEEKFHFYYQHYVNHYNNLKIEQKFTNMAAHKCEQWKAICAGDARFVQDAVLELKRSRHTLMSSYVHGYFIKRHMERELFEELQKGVEMSTEILAEVIARPHLKTPRAEIIQFTKDAHECRLTFLKRLREGLLPPMDFDEPQPRPLEEASHHSVLEEPQRNDDNYAMLLRLLSQLQGHVSTSSEESLDSIPTLDCSPQLLLPPTRPASRVVYPTPSAYVPSADNSSDQATPFHAPSRRQDSLVPPEVPAISSNDTNPSENDDEYYDQLQQALTLSLIEAAPEQDIQHETCAHQPQQILPQQQEQLQQSVEQNVDDEDEQRFLAELQLAMDISRAEQEPFSAQQEQQNDMARVSLDEDELVTMTTHNSTHPIHGTGYHGNNYVDDDDYIMLTGTHRSSPVLV